MNDEKLCPSCEEPVIEKSPACPLHCMSSKCKAYKKLNTDFSNKPIVWILGGPGCGKGLQCRMIADKYGFTHVSIGDLLRAEVKKGTDRSHCIADIMGKGGLVSSDIVLNVLDQALAERAAEAKGFLIDGYPRRKNQGAIFEKKIAPPSLIIYLETSHETLKNRLLVRAATLVRSDDNEETVKRRLKTFDEYNDKMLAQYGDNITRINNELSPAEVFAEVVKIIDPIVAKK